MTFNNKINFSSRNYEQVWASCKSSYCKGKKLALKNPNIRDLECLAMYNLLVLQYANLSSELGREK